jgi:serine/threonine-protein kinase PknG
VAEVGRSGPDTKVTIGSYAAREESLRDGLEATYRALAATESDTEQRYTLVDKANAVRRWTLQ